VCLAPADLHPAVDPLTGRAQSDARRADLTPSDAAALEYGLRAAEAWAWPVRAVAAGPPAIEPALSEAMALGVDVLRVDWPDAGSDADLADAAPVAAALAEAMTDADLVFCGDRSPWRGVGAVPAFLAHHLRAGQALGLVGLHFGEPGVVLAERRLDSGWTERLRVAAPAVLSVEAAGVRLRRAPLAGALHAARASVPCVAPDLSRGAVSGVRVGAPRPHRPRTRVVVAPPGHTRERLLALTGALVTREPPRIVGPLDAGAAADELLAYLARHGYR
jgi:electron transfer flavoprotein beta subunit